MCLHRIWTAWRSRESILPEVMDVRFAHLHGHPSKPGFIRGIPLLTVMIRIMPRRQFVRMTLPWVMHLPRLAMLPDIGGSGDMVDPRICKIRLSIMCRLFPLLTDTSLWSRNSIMYEPTPFFSQPFGMRLRKGGHPDLWSLSLIAWQGTEISRAIQITLHFRIILNTLILPIVMMFMHLPASIL